jgi:hypothetical protein
MPFPEKYNFHTIISILCPIHGIFNQRIMHHKSGQGCPKCHNEKQSKAMMLTREEWIRRFESVHSRGKYDYFKVPNEIKQNSVIEIYCPDHNISFFQTPDRHWRFKNGCPKCGHGRRGETVKKRLITRRSYEQQARAIHGLAFEYSELPLEFSLNDNIIIYCNEHNHVFFCIAQDHLSGKGCPKTDYTKDNISP